MMKQGGQEGRLDSVKEDGRQGGLEGGQNGGLDGRQNGGLDNGQNVINVINLPNTLTMLRIVAIPVFVTCLIYNHYLTSLTIFVLAAVTDCLDGLIARVRRQQTELGAFLDPMADKFLLTTSYILFAVYSWTPTWLTITIITRDLIVIVGWGLIYLIRHLIIIKPSIFGKAAIALQLVLAAYVLVRINFPGHLPVPVIFFWLTAFVTALSGLHYIYKGFVYVNS